MKQLLAFLFATGGKSATASAVLLLQRLLFGGLLLSHGLAKLDNYAALSQTFPDPIGLGSQLSVTLAIFAEVFCSAAFILGFLHRLVLIPMAFTMAVAFFVTHGGSIADGGELAFVYLGEFILLYVVGAGRYSADALIRPFVVRSRR